MRNSYTEARPSACSCCNSYSKCCCGPRECRKEAKELLAVPSTIVQEQMSTQEGALHPLLAEIQRSKNLGSRSGFIGGSCCVHLSLEFMPTDAASSGTDGLVLLLVEDSEGTVFVWAKKVPAGSKYQIKESVITTNPGAKVTLLVSAATARVRWAEVFSV